MSKEERDNFSERINELSRTLETKEETTAREKKALAKQHEKALKTSQEGEKHWQGLYTETRLENALLKGAEEAEAIQPAQIVTLMRGNTRLVEDRNDDGKPLGTYQVRVDFATKDEEGNPVTLDLDVSEALKRMKEDPVNGNLFKSGATAGVGSGTTGGSTKQPDFAKMSTAEWMEWRKEHSLDDIGKRK
jgi:hypothetical protein